MSRPRFSIIVTTYNFELYARAAAESALNQSEADKEVILVDDGSTDGTVQAVRDLPNVTILQQSNAGVAAARRTGFNASRGEFIVFLDGDDLLEPDYLRDTHDCLMRHDGAAFCYTWMRCFGARDDLMTLRAFDEEVLILEGNYIGIGALQRREIFEQVGGFGQLPSHEDWDYWIGAVDQGFKGVLLEKALYLYRQHQSGASRNYDWETHGRELKRLMRKRHPAFYYRNRIRRLLRNRDYRGFFKLLVE